MSRMIRVRETRSGLDCRFELLDALAPRAAEVLWALAAQDGALHDAVHAMWTGPEISCPVRIETAVDPALLRDIPDENATSFPAAGELATVFAPRGRWKGMPPFDVFDIGLFYGDGARLLMPMGWIMGSVCARVLPEDLAGLQAGCKAIRASGACRLGFSRVP